MIGSTPKDHQFTPLEFWASKTPRLEVQCGQVGQDNAELKRATTLWDVDQQLP